jgi:hypothetical protein
LSPAAVAADPCTPLYERWDPVYSLHNDYGDRVATQADFDYAKGVYRACEAGR